MEDILHNPVYHALLDRDLHLGTKKGEVLYFDEEVSPFVAFPFHYTNGFADLYDLLPKGRKILFATPGKIEEPKGWKLVITIPGLQFIHPGFNGTLTLAHTLKLLSASHAEEMVDLASLTKPGPFSMRTIEFGHYYGIFDNNKLVAMTGQRLHPGNYAEISAVCTHPDHLGKGYAAALLQHQLALITEQGYQPFLHVRDDNDRAISLYKRLGFTVSRVMNFYFMKRM